MDLVQQKLREVGRGLLSQPASSVREKARFDVVSNLDHWAEREVTDFLRVAFPDDTILSEESANRVDYADRIWVLDPLDGTANRTTDIPFFAISLALLEAGIPTQAFIYDPIHDEMFTASRGTGAFLNGEAITTEGERVRGVGVTSGVVQRLFDVMPPNFGSVAKRYGKLRALGSHALQLAYVACGRLVGAASVETKLWDNLAGALLVLEAGGRYSNLSGDAAFPIGEGHPALAGAACPCLAATEEAHAHLLPVLKQLVSPNG